MATALMIPGSCAANNISPLSLCGQPAKAGDVLVLYATGLGLATPNGDPNGKPLTTGNIAPADGSVLYETVVTPTITVGGLPAKVLFSGITPGLTGEYQIDFQVPDGMTGDDIPVVFGMGSSPTDTRTMSIQTGADVGRALSLCSQNPSHPASCIMKLSNEASGRKPTFLLHETKCLARARKKIVAKISEIAQRVGESEGMEIVEVEFKGGGTKPRLCASSSTSLKASPTPIASSFRSRWEQFWTWKTSYQATATRSKSAPRAWSASCQTEGFRAISGKESQDHAARAGGEPAPLGGQLAGFREGIVALEPSAGKLIRFPLEQVEKANLKFEW